MRIEIRRARAIEGGRVVCEVEFPNLGSFSRGLNELLRIEGAAFESSKAAAFTEAQQAHHLKLQAAARILVRGHPPRAYVPPYVDYPECPTLGGQPLNADEMKAGGTSSDDDPAIFDRGPGC